MLYFCMNVDRPAIDKSLQIRQLSNTDVDAYVSLLMRAVTEHPTCFGSSPTDIAGDKPDLETGNPESFVLGAFEQNGKLCGTVGFYRQTRPKLAHKGLVYRMYVPVEETGMGIGRQLLREMLGRARRQDGLAQINLVVTASNERAVALYAAEGFVAYGTEARSIFVNGEYYDEIHMVLFLS